MAYILWVRPIQASWAQQSARALMIEATVHLDVASQRRIQRLVARANPIKDRTFETLHIIGPCISGSFLYLS
jgi:hypothetical protein